MEKIPDYKIQPEEVELDTLAIFTNCSFHVHHDEDSRPGHSFLARFYILLNACIVNANMKIKKIEMAVISIKLKTISVDFNELSLLYCNMSNSIFNKIQKKVYHLLSFFKIVSFAAFL